MSYNDRNAGHAPRRDPNDSRRPQPASEEDDQERVYYKREQASTTSLPLPRIMPYDQVSYSEQYAQDPRAFPESYRAPPPAYPNEYARQPLVPYGQNAPRQRTAIACRYCRRRKIRCSGFDQNPDGRCVNCQRFQQECIFTPVSSQAQAFVPAHAVYPSMRNMTIGPDGRPQPIYPPQGVLFGAHGQPLQTPQVPSVSPYDYPASSPTDSYPSNGAEERNTLPPPSNPRGRPRHDHHYPHSILPPPITSQQLPYPPRMENIQNRRPNDEEFRLPPVTPTGAYPPVSSQTGRHPYNLHESLPQISQGSPPRPNIDDSRSNIMSLGRVMELRPNTEIDRNMLGRLSRRHN